MSISQHSPTKSLALLGAIVVLGGTLAVTPHAVRAQAGTSQSKAPAGGKARTGATTAPAVPNRPAAAAKEAPPADAAAREQILKSQAWQQTIQDFEGWLSTQTLYDAQQAKQIRARLEVGISRMTPGQLQWFQGDLQAKLQVLTSDQAKDAESYLSQTLSVASPAYARKIRQKLPDILTATASQVSQQLSSFAAKRQNTIAAQQAFNDNKQQQIAFNQTQIAQQQQVLNNDLDRESAAAINATKGNNFTKARDYFPNAGNDGPFGPGTSIGFWGGGFF
jgi:hypothetical protein